MLLSIAEYCKSIEEDLIDQQIQAHKHNKIVSKTSLGPGPANGVLFHASILGKDLLQDIDNCAELSSEQKSNTRKSIQENIIDPARLLTKSDIVDPLDFFEARVATPEKDKEMWCNPGTHDGIRYLELDNRRRFVLTEWLRPGEPLPPPPIECLSDHLSNQCRRPSHAPKVSANVQPGGPN